MRRILLALLAVAAFATSLSAASPLIVVGPVSAHYQSFTVNETAGRLLLPVNNFTLITTISSAVPFNATIELRVGNYSAVREALINGSYLVSFPVSMRFGEYPASITVYGGRAPLTSRNFTLTLSPPEISNVTLSSCGVSQALPATILFSTASMSFTVTSVAPIMVNASLAADGSSFSTPLLLNYSSTVSESIQLPLGNSSVSISLEYYGESLAAYSSFIIREQPTLSASYSYGNYTALLGNGTEAIVSTTYPLSISYQAPNVLGTKVYTSFSNGAQGTSIVFGSPGKYSGQVTLAYGSCSVDSIRFSVIAINPSVSVALINETLPAGIPSPLYLSVSFNQSLIKYVLLRTIGGVGVQVSPANYVLRYPGLVPIPVTPYSIGAGSISLSYSAMDYAGHEYGPFNASMMINSIAPSINIEAPSITYGEAENLTVILSFMGYPIRSAGVQVTITKGGQTMLNYVGKTNAEGRLIVEFTPPSTGTYIASAKFVSQSPIPIQNSTVFAVLQARPSLTIKLNSTQAVYGESVLINASLTPNAAAGIISIFVNNTLLTSRNGTSASFLFTPPVAGRYLIIAQYSGNQNYMPAESQEALIVGKATCSIRLEGVSGTVGEPLHLQGAISPTPSATIMAEINGTSLGSIQASPYFSLEFTPPLPGRYVANFSWSGNSNFNPCWATELIKVLKAVPSVELIPSTYYGVAGGLVTVDVIIKSNASLPTNSSAVLELSSGGVDHRIPIAVTNGTQIRLTLNGSTSIYLYYLGNEYYVEGVGGPIEINAIPGVGGLPLYSIVGYPIAALLGLLTAIIAERTAKGRR